MNRLAIAFLFIAALFGVAAFVGPIALDNKPKDIVASVLLAEVHRAAADEIVRENSRINDSRALGEFLDAVVKDVSRFADFDDAIRDETIVVSRKFSEIGLGGDYSVNLTPELRKKISDVLTESAERLEGK